MCSLRAPHLKACRNNRTLRHVVCNTYLHSVFFLMGPYCDQNHNGWEFILVQAAQVLNRNSLEVDLGKVQLSLALLVEGCLFLLECCLPQFKRLPPLRHSSDLSFWQILHNAWPFGTCHNILQGWLNTDEDNAWPRNECETNAKTPTGHNSKGPEAPSSSKQLCTMLNTVCR